MILLNNYQFQFRFKFLLPTIFILLLNNILCAQHLSTSFIQSPNASDLGIYGSIDISPFNGLANIEVNVFSLREKEITLNGTLRYFAGGVKPESRAGWVGQNWSLDIGGVITRKLNGIADEYAATEFNDDKTAAYLYHYDLLATQDWYTNSFIQGYWPNNTLDESYSLVPAPDEFLFRLPSGTSGSFFLNHEGKWAVKSSDNDDLKITVDINENPFRLENYYNLNNFIEIKRIIYKIVIIDKNGFKYTFGEKPNAIEFIRGPREHFYPNNEDVMANAWYLSKIEGPKGAEVEFEYERAENQYIQIVSYAHNESASFTAYLYANYGIAGNVFSMQPRSYSSTIITPSYLHEINSKSFHISFNKGKSLQLGYNYEYGVLDNYNYDDLYQDDDPTKRELLFHNPPYWYQLNAIEIYTEGQLKEKSVFSYNENSSERLFLNTLKKVEPTSGSTTLEYKFFYNETPLPAYNSLMVDEWGYYNGKLFPANTVGMPLSQVLSYLEPNEELMKAGLLTKLTYPTGGYTEITYEPNSFSSILKKSGNQINLVNESGEGGGVRVKKIIDYINSKKQVSREYYYNKSQTPSLSSGIMAGRTKIYYNYQIGNPALGTGEFITVNSGESLNYTEGREVVYSEVKEMFGDNSYNIYKYSNSDNIIYRDEVPTNIYSDAYVARFAYPPMSSAFSSSYTYPIISHNSRELERGKLLFYGSYNANGDLIHSLNNEYRDEQTRFDEYVRSYDYIEKSLASGDGLINERYFNAVKIYTYYPYLKKQTEVTFDMNGQNPLTIVTDFTYDDYRNIKEKTVQVNNGKKLITAFTFPYDYAQTPVPPVGQENLLLTERKMAEQHILSMPTEIVNYMEEDNVRKVQQASLNTFSELTGRNIIVPKQLYTLNNHSLLNDFVISSIEHRSTGSNYFEEWSFDERYNNILNYDEYDIEGNPLQVNSSKDGMFSYLWDYKSSYLSAEVKNAIQSDVATTSFEADGKGNWIYGGSPTSEEGGVTGSKSYSLSLGPVTKTELNASQKYLLTFWSKGIVNLSGGTQSNAIAGKTINGWTYHEITITNALSITLSGNTYIDELRLYPADAQMATYTYNPLIGMTSRCDENNRITYYEYDGFGRLHIIKDEEGNIIRKICYNYAGEPEDCNIIYKSQKKSAIFTRNNCATGYFAGPSVTYTVEADSYTSEISQADADSKADADITANGQNYANTHGLCYPYSAFTKISIENRYGDIGDVVIRFYADELCTIPYYISDLNVDVQVEKYNDITAQSTYENFTIECTGESVVAFPSALLVRQVNDQYHSLEYSFFTLLPGVGYTIIYQ